MKVRRYRRFSEYAIAVGEFVDRHLQMVIFAIIGIIMVAGMTVTGSVVSTQQLSSSRSVRGIGELYYTVDERTGKCFAVTKVPFAFTNVVCSNTTQMAIEADKAALK